jgi:ABC-type amino acid transport substrate-binding protein
LAYTQDRAKKAIFLNPPLFTTEYVLAARANDPVVVNNTDDLRKLGADGVVLGVHGMLILERLAEQEGIRAEDGGTTPQANLDKLVNGRGRFFLYRSVGIKTIVHDAGLDAKVRILPAVIMRTELFMLASKHLPKEQANRLEKAIERLKQNGELDRIYAKWRD